MSDDNSSIQTQLLVTPPEGIGFTRADGPRSLVFPADHGAHPDFQTEWWYYTGNLQTKDGRHFGYQLTFFRRALLPPDEVQGRLSLWSTNQVFMAHFSLTDVAAGNFHYYERFSRAAADLAGAQAPPYRVWLENWSVEQINKHQYLLQAAQDDIALELILTDEKGPILHGEKGYSRKGHEPGNASYYFSQTRLVSEGSVAIKDQRFTVVGNSWMDHEFSTSALSSGQVGWDWFALQLDDGSELMVFQIRKDGKITDELIDPNSSGTLIHGDGSYSHLNFHDFEIIVHDTWKSPHTGADYPAGWTINIPHADISLMVKPYLTDQELSLSFTYWEGAVRIDGFVRGHPVSGSGYAELTGYAGSMAGEF
ncbi:MAG: carotenoid 1,2-hydratase [Anaerolineales bacterium]|nr:carotenoid 1,2-hydratase [Anaerolineales bacterium]